MTGCSLNFTFPPRLPGSCIVLKIFPFLKFSSLLSISAVIFFFFLVNELPYFRVLVFSFFSNQSSPPLRYRKNVSPSPFCDGSTDDWSAPDSRITPIVPRTIFFHFDKVSSFSQVFVSVMIRPLSLPLCPHLLASPSLVLQKFGLIHNAPFLHFFSRPEKVKRFFIYPCGAR